MNNNRTIAYLSGAPRVTTREDSDSAGPRSHVLGTIAAYRQLGWKLHIFIYGDRIRPGAATSFLRSLVKTSWPGRIAGDIARYLLGLRNSRKALAEIPSTIDYVYERFAVLQALGAGFQRKGIPWILETQGLFFHEARHDRNSLALVTLARHVEVSAYRVCDVLIVVSDRLKEIIVKETGAVAEKIIVVPNGVDLLRFNLAIYPVPNNPVPIIGFVGSLIKWQGIDRLLLALAEVKAAGMAFKFILVGDGDQLEPLKELATRLNLQQQVEFTGRVNGDDVPRQISRFDIGFSGQLPSVLGGMYHSPLKIYEYMAMGKPVIASDFADARKVIDGIDSGFLFDPADSDSLTNTLKTALADSARFRQMGENAYQEILANHSWEARVRDMTAAIDIRLGQRS